MVASATRTNRITVSSPKEKRSNGDKGEICDNGVMGEIGLDVVMCDVQLGWVY